MANIGLPKILAVCSCGRVLEKDSPRYDDPYWTLCPVDIVLPVGLPEAKCPVCGGDANVPMGDYYYQKCPASHHISV